MDIDPATPAYLAARVAAILASPAVIVKRAPTPSAEPWPFDVPEPADLAALYAVTDGIELADGTVILRRAELAGTTAWLKQEKSLDDWAEGIFVLGERSDLVIARDLDPAGTRAGGGVLEAPTDGLSTFKRAAFGVVGYLEGRLSPAGDPLHHPRWPRAMRRRAAMRRRSQGRSRGHFTPAQIAISRMRRRRSGRFGRRPATRRARWKRSSCRSRRAFARCVEAQRSPRRARPGAPALSQRSGPARQRSRARAPPA